MRRDGDPETLEEAVAIIRDAWFRQAGGKEISYDFGAKVIRVAAAWGKEIHNLHHDALQKDPFFGKPKPIPAPSMTLRRTSWSPSPLRALPYMVTQEAFIGRKSVIEERNFTSYHHACMDKTRAMVLSASRMDGWFRSSFEFGGFCFWVRGDEAYGMGDIVAAIVGRETELAGGINMGTPWVEPHFRRQGVGRALILCAHWEQAHTERRFLSPVSYSVLGHKAHVSAHRKSVEIALDLGITVGEDVLADYPEIGRQVARAMAPSM